MFGALAYGITFAPSCIAQTTSQPTSQQRESLKMFLQKHLGDPHAPFEQEGPTSYSTVFVDLKDDGTKEVIAYVTGRGWCGSGGCVMLILEMEGASYRVVTETTVTQLPIRVLPTKLNGWHDISVVVSGGGIQPGYEAILSFDGKTYPTNPTVPPARRLAGKAQGKIVMPANVEAQLLYK
jgi:hypothetical protein